VIHQSDDDHRSYRIGDKGRAGQVVFYAPEEGLSAARDDLRLFGGLLGGLCDRSHDTAGLAARGIVLNESGYYGR
jgi:hypothetical protein